MMQAQRQIHRARKDRLSITIVPEQTLDTGFQTPYLTWLFDDLGVHQSSRLVRDDLLDEQDEAQSFFQAEAAVMSEVSDWLALRDCDKFWAPRNKQPQKVSSSIQLTS